MYFEDTIIYTCFSTGDDSDAGPRGCNLVRVHASVAHAFNNITAQLKIVDIAAHSQPKTSLPFFLNGLNVTAEFTVWLSVDL